jgi:hypothetical protein
MPWWAWLLIGMVVGAAALLGVIVYALNQISPLR